MGQIHKPSVHQLSSNTKSWYGRDAFLASIQTRPKGNPTPTSGTNAMIPRRPRFRKTHIGNSPPHTSHCKEDIG